MSKNKNRRKSGEKPGLWESLFGMIREVLIASMNKGQFPLALFGVTIIAIIYRMPPARVADVADRCLEFLVQGYLAGYAIAVVTIVLWFFHSKAQRRNISDELKRLSGERTKLQKRLIGRKIESSDK